MSFQINNLYIIVCMKLMKMKINETVILMCKTANFVLINSICLTSELSDIKRYPKMLCSLGQFFCKLLNFFQRLPIWEVQCCILGGHCQLLQESTQMIALTQNGLAGPYAMGFLAQGVHQSTAHHDYQLTLGDEFLWRLAILKAVHKSPNGLLESTKVKPAMLRQAGWLMFFCATSRCRGVLAISLGSEEYIR